MAKLPQVQTHIDDMQVMLVNVDDSTIATQISSRTLKHCDSHRSYHYPYSNYHYVLLAYVQVL